MAGSSVKPIYVLFGNDTFLRDENRKKIISQLVGDADPQVCVGVFEATADLAQVLDELRTMPFLAPRRVVIVRDADAFVSAYRESIEKYLESPAQCGSLVLMVSSWPKNTRLYKAVAKVGEAIDCSEPDVRDLPRWLQSAAAKRDKKISRDAAELMAEWVGANLSALDSEIEKLATYVGDRKTITANDVGELVAATAGPEAFELTNALTESDPSRAIKALSGMLTVRGEEFRTLGMIAWHLRRALQAKQMISAGKSPDSVLRSVRVFYNKPSFIAMLKRRPMKKMQADFRKLLYADLAMKSGTTPTAALQDLVVGLCS